MISNIMLLIWGWPITSLTKPNCNCTSVFCEAVIPLRSICTLVWNHGFPKLSVFILFCLFISSISEIKISMFVYSVVIMILTKVKVVVLTPFRYGEELEND